MDVVEELKRGLNGSKKFVPFWYKFDETGCNYYNENIQHNEYYYLHKSEKQLISENVLVSSFLYYANLSQQLSQMYNAITSALTLDI